VRETLAWLLPSFRMRAPAESSPSLRNSRMAMRVGWARAWKMSALNWRRESGIRYISIFAYTDVPVGVPGWRGGFDDRAGQTPRWCSSGGLREPGVDGRVEFEVACVVDFLDHGEAWELDEVDVAQKGSLRKILPTAPLALMRDWLTCCVDHDSGSLGSRRNRSESPKSVNLVINGK